MGALARVAAAITGLSIADERALPPPTGAPVAGPAPRVAAGGWSPLLAPYVPTPGNGMWNVLGVDGAGVYSREAALSIPALASARDKLVTAITPLPLRFWRVSPDPNVAAVAIPAPTWAVRPDPDKPRAWTVGGLVDDLVFYGLGYWLVLSRYTDTGYPAAFRWMPYEETNVGLDGVVRWTPGARSGFAGRAGAGPLEFVPGDVVEFCSPQVPLLETGAVSLTTTMRLEAAAARFANVEMPAGWLQQVGGEPLTSAEMTGEAQKWSSARLTNTIAMLNEFVEWHESTMDPARLQLTEARNHQAIECGRLTNVPAALLDADVSSMTYSNQRDAMIALWYFGAFPLADAIGQVLSGPNVTPRGTSVEFDPARILEAPAFAALDSTSVRPRPGGPPDA